MEQVLPERAGAHPRFEVLMRRGDAVDDAGSTGVESDGEGAFGQRLLGVEHAIERVEQLARGHQRGQRRAARGLQAGIEQCLRRGIHLLHHRAPRKHQHRGGQVVDHSGAVRRPVDVANRRQIASRRNGLDSGHGHIGNAGTFGAWL